MDGLTPLERELLSYVEQLTRASEASAQALQNCERRWARETKAELESLKQCVALLGKSQAQLTASLNDWMGQRQTYEQLSPQLRQSVKNALDVQNALKR